MGNHTITIGSEQNGLSIDKIKIINYQSDQNDKGAKALNLCVPDTSTVDIPLFKKFEGYVLHQNYPNPFNKKTSISFEIPKRSHVSFIVFNIAGIEIAELINEELNTGKHTVEFDTANLPKGTYFYRIEAGKYTAMKKMILITD